LAFFLERQLEREDVKGYYADVEYNRKQRGKVKTIIDGDHRVVSITADLIVHSRGEYAAPRDNLIAVEAKKSSRPEQEKIDDKERLVAMTSEPYNGVWNWEDGHPEHVCGYKLGVFMEVSRERGEVLLEYFKRGHRTKHKVLRFSGDVVQQGSPRAVRTSAAIRRGRA
jgi:hypothetical protein